MITGTGVHDRTDSVFRINWTGCSRSNGIRVHDRPDYAPMDVDELERLSNGIQYSQEELSASVLDALHAAIKTQFDEIEAYAENIDSESTLSDHKRILQKLGPKVGLGLSMIDDAIKVIDRRIEKIAEGSEEVEAPSFTKAKPVRSDEFSDKDLESLFHSLLIGKS